jgi:hypothetical protein
MYSSNAYQPESFVGQYVDRFSTALPGFSEHRPPWSLKGPMTSHERQMKPFPRGHGDERRGSCCERELEMQRYSAVT